MVVFGLAQLHLEIIIALLFILAAFISAKVISYFFIRVLGGMAEKTKADGELVWRIKRLQTPILAVAMLVGLNLGLKYVTLLAPYHATIDLVLAIAYLLVGAVVVTGLFDMLVTFYLKKIVPQTKLADDSQLMPVVRNVLKLFIYIAAVILIIGRLGYDIAPMLAGLGIAGIAVALGLQGTLSSFFAGLYILADKPVRKGDFVRLSSGEDGHIESIGWRTTRIRAISNYVIIVPNTRLVETIIQNYSISKKPVSMLVSVMVDNRNDAEEVEKIIRDEAAKAQKVIEGIVSEFEPIVRFENFSDLTFDFAVIFGIKSYTDHWRIAGTFKKSLFKRFKKDRIIMVDARGRPNSTQLSLV